MVWTIFGLLSMLKCTIQWNYPSFVMNRKRKMKRKNVFIHNVKFGSTQKKIAKKIFVCLFQLYRSTFQLPMNIHIFFHGLLSTKVYWVIFDIWVPYYDLNRILVCSKKVFFFTKKKNISFQQQSTTTTERKDSDKIQELFSAE